MTVRHQVFTLGASTQTTLSFKLEGLLFVHPQEQISSLLEGGFDPIVAIRG